MVKNECCCWLNEINVPLVYALRNKTCKLVRDGGTNKLPFMLLPNNHRSSEMNQMDYDTSNSYMLQVKSYCLALFIIVRCG